jgi:hypothetical protein
MPQYIYIYNALYIVTIFPSVSVMFARQAPLILVVQKRPVFEDTHVQITSYLAQQTEKLSLYLSV